MMAAGTLLASRWTKAAGVALAGVCALAAATSHSASNGGVLKVRMAGDAQQTRVVVELDRSAKAKVLTQDGKTLVLSWPDLDVNADLDGAGKGLVSAWTVQESGGSARLKLNLARDSEVVRRFLLPPADGIEVYRYVVDLKAKPGSPEPVLAQAAPAKPVQNAKAAPKTKAEPKLAVMISAPKEAPKAKRVIVIDAGHGGKDPGAIGIGAREKDVTLASARILKAQLEKTGRYRVVLTRDKDEFVPLEQRVRIARKAGADLFISLHADAGSAREIHGASVYTLSENGSHRVAQRVMNKDKRFGEVRLPGQDRAVNQILLDLTQRQTRNQSATFAQLLLHEIDDELTLLRSSHRDAGFVVLLAPDVPAVLLEMGFMTNPDDEKALTNPAKRKRVMARVAASIEDYFSQGAKYAAR